MAVLDSRIGPSCPLNFGVGKIVEMLQYFGVPQTCHQMERGNRRDDPANIVGSNYDGIGLGSRTDFLGFQQTARLRHIGLQNTDTPSRKQITEGSGRVVALAHGDWNTGMPRHHFECPWIIWPAGFLDPSRFILLDGLRNLDCLIGSKPSMHFNKHLDFPARDGKHSLQYFKASQVFGAREFQVTVCEGIEFQRTVTPSDDRFGSRSESLRGKIDAIPAIRICGDALPHFSSD